MIKVSRSPLKFLPFDRYFNHISTVHSIILLYTLLLYDLPCLHHLCHSRIFFLAIRTPDFPSSFTNNQSILEDPTHPLSLSHHPPSPQWPFYSTLPVPPGHRADPGRQAPPSSSTPFSLPCSCHSSTTSALESSLIQASTGQSRRMWRRKSPWRATGSDLPHITIGNRPFFDGWQICLPAKNFPVIIGGSPLDAETKVAFAGVFFCVCRRKSVSPKLR
jgi:hypothetical protein